MLRWFRGERGFGLGDDNGLGETNSWFEIPNELHPPPPHTHTYIHARTNTQSHRKALSTAINGITMLQQKRIQHKNITKHFMNNFVTFTKSQIL